MVIIKIYTDYYFFHQGVFTGYHKLEFKNIRRWPSQGSDFTLSVIRRWVSFDVEYHMMLSSFDVELYSTSGRRLVVNVGYLRRSVLQRSVRQHWFHQRWVRGHSVRRRSGGEAILDVRSDFQWRCPSLLDNPYPGDLWGNLSPLQAFVADCTY